MYVMWSYAEPMYVMSPYAEPITYVRYVALCRTYNHCTLCGLMQNLFAFTLHSAPRSGRGDLRYLGLDPFEVSGPAFYQPGNSSGGAPSRSKDPFLSIIGVERVAPSLYALEERWMIFVCPLPFNMFSLGRPVSQRTYHLVRQRTYHLVSQKMAALKCAPPLLPLANSRVEYTIIVSA
ncbi:hypothetical protein DPMN_021249 [Dreissena polymorpha]|uniref:Uncharacterized protein n=1 Tax=Dreissena polymorpha TaxID=45954 RepID=A0A9D4NKF1_DREPO|nr:hypothetical protein DPMN_021249 [Dreissena polymorpha]